MDDTDKKLLRKIIKKMSDEQILAAVLDLGEKVSLWQKLYNETTVSLELSTGKKYLKVSVETPIVTALHSFGAFNE